MSKIKRYNNEVVVDESLCICAGAVGQNIFIYGCENDIHLSKSELEELINHLTELKNKMQ